MICSRRYGIDELIRILAVLLCQHRFNWSH